MDVKISAPSPFDLIAPRPASEPSPSPSFRDSLQSSAPPPPKTADNSGTATTPASTASTSPSKPTASRSSDAAHVEKAKPSASDDDDKDKDEQHDDTAAAVAAAPGVKQPHPAIIDATGDKPQTAPTDSAAVEAGQAALSANGTPDSDATLPSEPAKTSDDAPPDAVLVAGADAKEALEKVRKAEGTDAAVQKNARAKKQATVVDDAAKASAAKSNSTDPPPAPIQDEILPEAEHPKKDDAVSANQHPSSDARPATIDPTVVANSDPAANLTPPVADASQQGTANSDPVTTAAPSGQHDIATSAALSAPKPPAVLIKANATPGESAVRAGEIDPARFLHRVVKAFESAQQRDGEVRLRLQPAELGSLSIEVKVQDHALTARVQAETPEAKAAILDNLPALRDRLADQGIRIDKFDVDLMDHSDRQQQQFLREQAQDQTSQRGATPRVPNARALGVDRDSPTSSPIQAATKGGLNVVI